ncbi:MAG: 30S ribosomal protein S6 [Dehalococcoidales bacterium]|nr:MAG: 30S ribosomal protein S6 [Dehalococcoidales bacterium]
MVSKNVSNQVSEELCDYELIVVVRPEADEENFETTIESVDRFITGKGGVVSEVERWGKRRLAYPIKQYGEGYYVLTRFQMKPEFNEELETNLKISEEVIRHLLIKLG